MKIKYSVIIPTLNRSGKLKLCLTCLAQLNFEPDLFEILVIDNGSTDDTRDVTLSFKNKFKNLEYHFFEEPGLMVARHAGCDCAKADVLCYIDDDSFVTKSWLRGIGKAFSDPEVVLVGGPCLPEYEIEPPMWLSQFWSDTNWGKWLGSLSLLDFGEQVKSIFPYYVFGCNFNIRKDILLKLGGFHPDAMPRELIRYRGDGETFVSKRLIEFGHKALYSPDAKIHHFVPASRMTTEYFCHRAYIQGISDSFMQIREEHGLDTEHAKGKGQRAKGKENKDNRYQINIRSICSFLKRGANSIKNRALNYKRKLFPTEYDLIRAEMQKAHREGFAYHQREIQKDPKLLEWVLRKNYLGENGKLPK